MTLQRMLLVSLVILLLFSRSAACNELTGLPGGIKCADMFNNNQPVCWLEIEIGTISDSTPEDVLYLVARRDSFARKVLASTVRLDSLGGSLSAAMRLGHLIRDQKLSAIVDTPAQCVSACVFVLAAALERKIKGRVGIHRPYFGDAASETNEIIHNYTELLKVAREYLASMGAANDLLDEMLRIEPTDVRFLTRSELNAFGIGEGPRTANIETIAAMKEAIAAKAAAAYRLSRLARHGR